MNRSIPILMLLCVSLLAREELSPVQKCPASHHMEQTQNTHDIALEIRLECER